jgi:hypothetical protein
MPRCGDPAARREDRRAVGVRIEKRILIGELPGWYREQSPRGAAVVSGEVL